MVTQPQLRHHLVQCFLGIIFRKAGVCHAAKSPHLRVV